MISKPAFGADRVVERIPEGNTRSRVAKEASRGESRRGFYFFRINLLSFFTLLFQFLHQFQIFSQPGLEAGREYGNRNKARVSGDALFLFLHLFQIFNQPELEAGREYGNKNKAMIFKDSLFSVSSSVSDFQSARIRSRNGILNQKQSDDSNSISVSVS
jgi:hypothetical protein